LPVFLLVVFWIKMASPGSLFFKQERIGFGGRRFTLFKFRTMKSNVETGGHEKYVRELIEGNAPMTKLDALGDPRITPGGRILRATGLDELPQLLNIFRGEMSLVGPRPCTLLEWERFAAWQRQRANAVPGLTGYWQVNGKNRTTFSQMIEMDIWYTQNSSLSLDLEIILRTIPAILGQVLDRKGVPPVSPSALASLPPEEEEEPEAASF
jgi:lipopolysaccharide/colanic/teichoic acid biosynthesis glycosyltransferase